jgi:hypothetical protein
MEKVAVYVIHEETKAFPFYEFEVKCRRFSFMTLHPSNISRISFLTVHKPYLIGYPPLLRRVVPPLAHTPSCTDRLQNGTSREY